MPTSSILSPFSGTCTKPLSPCRKTRWKLSVPHVYAHSSFRRHVFSSSLQVTEKIAFKNESFPQPGPEEMKPGGALHDAHRVPGMPARRQKLQDGIICIGIHYFRILQNLYLANLLFNSSRTGFTSDCLLSTHFFQFASKSPLWRIRLAYSF